MKYCDLHLHPLGKHQLGGVMNTSKEKTKIDGFQPIPLSKEFKDYTDEEVLRRLESQGSLYQMKNGEVHNAVAAVGALEFGVACSKGFLTDILKTTLKNPLNKDYFERVREGKVSYLRLFLENLNNYFQLSHNEKLVLINRGIEVKEPERVKLLLAIDGGYNLCFKKIGNALDFEELKNPKEQKNQEKKASRNNKNDGDKIPSNQNGEQPESVETIKMQDWFDYLLKNHSRCPSEALKFVVDKIREKGGEVLYLTLAQLTHIPEQHLATHAYGTKMLKHPSFFPFGNGLTELGKKVVEKADMLTKGADKDKSKAGNKAPVYIDITHLSLKSREDLYRFRKEKNINSPLIASHVAVTGYSIKGWKDNLQTGKCLNHLEQGVKTVKIYARPKVAGYWGGGSKQEFVFHPGTINLMDEDIIAIVNSGGLMGLSLDAELLGNTTEALDMEDSCEFISTPDFTHYFPYTSVKTMEHASREQLRAEEAWLKPKGKYTHPPLSLCFNIVHILAVINLKTDKGDEEAQNYICIGSNFDGFIEPLKVCSASTEFKNLEACLKKWLPVAAKKYRKVNGGASDSLSFMKTKGELADFVKKLLSINMTQFVLNNYGHEKSADNKGVMEPVEN